MQMAKIASALYIHHQKDKRLLYLLILISPTAHGVTASFAMLGDIIIAEPAYIVFAGKRVIKLTLGQKVIEDFQVTKHLFGHGLFDPIVS